MERGKTITKTNTRHGKIIREKTGTEEHEWENSFNVRESEEGEGREGDENTKVITDMKH
jgi:hypothetical protein